MILILLLYLDCFFTLSSLKAPHYQHYNFSPQTIQTHHLMTTIDAMIHRSLDYMNVPLSASEITKDPPAEKIYSLRNWCFLI